MQLTLTILGGGALLGALVAAGRVQPSSTSLPVMSGVGSDPGEIKESDTPKPASGHQLAAFSGGCFWGVEDEFRQVPGVVATAVGFTGGTVPHPSYEQVCTHTTGHAETCLIEFDPKKVTYRQLVEKFWAIHDPTTVDRQGPDEGNSYRSAIWTFTPEEFKEAQASKVRRQPKEKAPIVTQIAPAMPFYLAEDYHQQYDQKNGTHFCPTRSG